MTTAQPTRRASLRANEGDPLAPVEAASLPTLAVAASQEELIELVLSMFLATGMPAAGIPQLRRRLECDSVFYVEWCGCIDEWWPNWEAHLNVMRRNGDASVCTELTEPP